MTALLRTHFKDKFTERRPPVIKQASEAFMRLNSQREKVAEFRNLLLGQKFKDCGEIRKEIMRDRWEEFFSASRVTDLKAAYQYFATAEGRASLGFRPSCWDPLWYGEKWHMSPRGTAEVLGEFF